MVQRQESDMHAHTELHTLILPLTAVLQGAHDLSFSFHPVSQCVTSARLLCEESRPAPTRTLGYI